MAELPTPEALAALPEDDLLCSIEATKRRIAELNSLLDAYLGDLTRRVNAGELDPGFVHNGWGFTLSAGRRNWDYPASVKKLEEEVKAAKENAQADGSATASLGAAFWTFRAPQQKEL